MSFRALFLPAYLALAAAVTACGIPTPDISTAVGQEAILDDVNNYLTQGNCSSALIELEPLYDSTYTSNTVRMTMASVYGCFSGINVFQLVANMASANVGLGYPWSFFAQQFPSTSSADKKVEAAGFGMDAVMAVLNPGEVLIAADLFNAGTDNEGSLLSADRTTDANLYLFFLAMSAIGAEENRQGASAAGLPDNSPALPWVKSSTSGMSTDGCSYASAVVNFADALAVVDTNVTGPLGTAIQAVENAAVSHTGETYEQLIYNACNDGCANITPVGNPVFDPGGGWIDNDVQCNTTCGNCPLLLRNRFNCTGVAGDQPSCAAAGVINFINNSIVGW